VFYYATYQRSYTIRLSFAASTSEVGPKRHPLLHLCDIYATRSSELWKQDSAAELLYDGAALAVQQLGETGESPAEKEVRT
jgi:hypothetical protein